MGRLIGQENGQRARPCRNHQLQVQPGPMAGTKLDHDITDGDAASAALAARRHRRLSGAGGIFPKSQCSTCERIHCRCRIHCAGLVTGPATSPSVLRSGSGRWAFEGRASKSGGSSPVRRSQSSQVLSCALIRPEGGGRLGTKLSRSNCRSARRLSARSCARRTGANTGSEYRARTQAIRRFIPEIETR